MWIEEDGVGFVFGGSLGLNSRVRKVKRGLGIEEQAEILHKNQQNFFL